MGMFDADSYLEALETPTLKIEGKVYKGKIMSVDEYLPFAVRFDELPKINTEDQPTVAELKQFRSEYNKLRYEFLRATFPWKLTYLFGDPVNIAVKSRLADEVFGNFFALAAANLQPKAAKTKTNGINSPNDP